MAKEQFLEQKMVKRIREAGGLCLKFVSPGYAGVPDRIALFLGGRVVFVEVKAPGERPRPLQIARIKKLRNMGFRVKVVDSEEKIDELIKSMEGAKDGI